MALLKRASLGVCPVLLVSLVAGGEDPPPLSPEVAKAVAKAQDFLRQAAKEIHGPKRSLPSSKYGEKPPPWSTVVAGHDERAAHLAAYALVASGVSRGDPAVRLLHDVIEARIKKGEYRTYDLALTVLALLEEGTERKASIRSSSRKAVEEAVERIEKGQLGNGAWAYEATESYRQGGLDEGWGDLSNTQFAVLALGAAERKRVKVSEGTWERIRSGFAKWYSPVPEAGKGSVDAKRPGARAYEKRGGWSYHPMNSMAAKSGTMTCAGICSMILSEAATRGKPVEKIATEDLPEVVSALRYLAEIDLPAVFPPLPARSKGEKGTAPAPHVDLYHLYSIERTGALARQARIGKWDWYAEGTSQLLVSQREDGSWWGGSYGSVVDTSFALLFLSRATAGTYGTKYQVGGDERHALVGDGGGEGDEPQVVEADPNAPAPEPETVAPLNLPPPADR